MDENKPVDELHSDQAFVDLFGNVSARTPPPEADELLIREAIHKEWRSVTGKRTVRQRWTSIAIAASVLLAVFVSLNSLREPVVDIGSQLLATVQKQSGNILVNGRTVSDLAALEIGDSLETGAGAVMALAWQSGGSLRIDESTLVSFTAPGQVYLRQGRVYFDSAAGPLVSQTARRHAADLEIRTDFGVVRHLGTQYMTEIGAGELIVSVREGIVSIDGKARAARGQRFAMSAAGVLSTSDTNGVDGWEWIERSTPGVNLDDQPIHVALEWVSRESGRRIQYASAEAEALAKSENLRGDFNIEPSRALGIFMATADLEARIEGQVIVVSTTDQAQRN